MPTARATVLFPVSAEVAYDYLVEPRNRPEWQWSLASVEVADGAPVVAGLRWVDVTRVPGVRPALVLTVAERPHRWAETGTFRGFSAELTLDLAPRVAGGLDPDLDPDPGPGPGSGCRVTAAFAVRGWGIGRLLTATGLAAVRADLRRAARILGDR